MRLCRAQGALCLGAASIVVFVLLVAGPAFAAESRQDVLIGFRTAPNAALVQAVGGRV